MADKSDKAPDTAKSVKSRLSVAMAQGRTAQSTQRLITGAEPLPPMPPASDALDGSTAIIPPPRAGAPVLPGPAQAAKAALQTRKVAPRKRVPSDEKSDAEKCKRQRVRPETRTQMLERLTNPLVTLHEASVLLRVCTATVRRYSNSGQLPHLRTEGGQRRFYLKDVLNLLKEIEGRKK
jgi:excisionase family DNA binding protein